MRVLVLAAGFATRLFPITRNCAKPLLDIAGKTALTRILGRVLTLPEVTEVVVVANARFHSDFAAWRASFATATAVRILNDGAMSDDDKLGAIADMKLGFDALDPDAAAGTLVVAGDNLLDFDLAPYAADLEQAHHPTIFFRRLDGDVPPGRYGEVVLDEDDGHGGGAIASFREKPADPCSRLTSICLYYLPPGTEKLIDTYLDSGGNPDAPGHFLEWLVAHACVHGLPVRGRYFDLGNRQNLEDARAAFARQT